MTDHPSSRRESCLLVVAFALTLVAHFYLATTNWNSGFMPGHEFRQAQTALVSYYIDQDDNFSLRYETPIFGKPWVALPLEVPFYEWSVVALSRATGLPHFKSARGITLACFYLTLPALYLLLGELKVGRSRRLLALALVLTCPVYIFYSRAFLIESMELMCSAWFLLGYIRAMRERRWRWFALATVAGTGASLIKNTTFAVWLLPAAAYAAWLLYRDLRTRAGWRATSRTLAWGAGSVLVPLVALYWWLGYSDAIKSVHPSTYIFTSKNLSTGNFGLLNFATRFSAETWKTLFDRWHEAIMAPWLIAALLLLGAAFLPAARRGALAFLGLFLLAQLLFPYAYAYQDYYFYACAVYLAVAISFVLFSILDSRLPRWLCALILAIPFTAQVLTYWQSYRKQQIVVSQGGSGLTDALRDITPKDSVFIIAGNDWAAMVPLYSQHRALMIRRGLENDAAYLDRAFADLDDEDVAAVILLSDQRANRDLLHRAMAKFQLDEIPTFTHATADVYFTRFYRDYVITFLKANNPYEFVKVRETQPIETLINKPLPITAGMGRTAFRTISPGPFRARFGYGYDRVWSEGDMVLSAHPDTDIWLRAPADATTIDWDFGLHPSSYTRTPDKTEGVVFTITGESPDGAKREVYRRVLDPAHNEADRGRQREVIRYQPVPGETLIFSTRPNRGYSYDWAYIARIVVK